MSTGSAIPAGTRPIVDKTAGLTSYAEGQACSAEGCTTLLSGYNSLNVCARHDPRHGPH